MGEAIFCYICTANVGVRVVCCFQAAIHLALLVVPPCVPPGNLLIVFSNFLEYIFCAVEIFDTDAYSEELPKERNVCVFLQVFTGTLLIIYAEALNFIMMVCNLTLIAYGYSRKFILINYIISSLFVVLQVYALGIFTIYKTTARPEGYFILIFTSLFLWGISVGIMALRKRIREDSRLQHVKILINNSDEPALLEEPASLTSEIQTEEEVAPNMPEENPGAMENLSGQDKSNSSSSEKDFSHCSSEVKKFLVQLTRSECDCTEERMMWDCDLCLRLLLLNIQLECI
ncbi:uncharacterized protein LOC111695661 [Eurytemora carolleeae]|uniref:uncharacterized protein LOC111695661 n=1 Tax=Eurytemora carolleeae TaxID=1294199 RepID=UPI000C7795C5|nr:uncharacterized protein LOC111695661 [Eurytemora carolleeae]|eukprot:XP_023320829.1 uncharacterized protein LOC111695661 [Eurytemora affinis]